MDTNRLYTTGQSMGGMMSFYFNITHPDLFAALLFVSSQWDTTKMKDFGKKHFFYIVAGGDQKASGSVLPETGRAMEHMASFDYGYKIAAVRGWLFKQSK